MIELVGQIEGIGIDPKIENGGGEYDPIPFHYCYGNSDACDMQEEGNCSNDGILWQADDMGAPYFCTNHYFPQEQLGYEFVEMGEVKYD